MGALCATETSGRYNMGDSVHSSTCHMRSTMGSWLVQMSGVAPVSLSGCSDEAEQNFDRIHVRHPECREVATSTSKELDVDSKQFHDKCTGNWRYVFIKVVYDHESFIPVDNIIGMSGFQP